MAKYVPAFGQRLKQLRRDRGLALREFCRQNGFDHGNTSRIERGLARPPTGERLDRYLEALGVEPETDEWRELHDLAHTCAGEIPPHVMAEEEVVRRLPIIFRTMGRQKPTDKQLDELLAIVRREMNQE